MKNRSPAAEDLAQSAGAPPITSADVVSTLLAGGGLRVVKFAKAIIFSQGEPSERIFFIERGRVETRVVSHLGKEGSIALYTKGDFIGEASLTPYPAYLDSAITVTQCDLVAIDRAAMRSALDTNAPLAAYFTNFLLQRTLDVQADLIDHLFNSSEKRLARVLLLLANFGDGGVLEPITDVTHQMLAQRVGTTRARISFFMNKFRRLGYLDYNGSIKVHSSLIDVVLHDPRTVVKSVKTARDAA